MANKRNRYTYVPEGCELVYIYEKFDSEQEAVNAAMEEYLNSNDSDDPDGCHTVEICMVQSFPFYQFLYGFLDKFTGELQKAHEEFVGDYLEVRDFYSFKTKAARMLAPLVGKHFKMHPYERAVRLYTYDLKNKKKIEEEKSETIIISETKMI